MEPSLDSGWALWSCAWQGVMDEYEDSRREVDGDEPEDS